jgi:hypothetical protein
MTALRSVFPTDTSFTSSTCGGSALLSSGMAVELPNTANEATESCEKSLMVERDGISNDLKNIEPGKRGTKIF